MSKSAALDTKLEVIRSALPASKPKLKWRQFDDLEIEADLLVDYYQRTEAQLERIRQDAAAPPKRADFEHNYQLCIAPLVETCRQLWESYEPDGGPDEERGCCPGSRYDSDGVIKHRHVSERVGVMIGSFPNAVPHAPEVYTRMLVEHIIAGQPSVLALEATCREIERTAKFVPSISEVLTVLRTQHRLWSKRWNAVWEVEGLYQKMIERLP